MKVIVKIIARLTNKVILTDNLNNNQKFNQILQNRGIYIYKGDKLKFYMIYNIIDYIAKIRKEETVTQEIFILANSLNEIVQDTILFLATKLKRVNIVTFKIKNFTKISDYLESRGIAITVTNNKRKSLSKAKIIVNMDFDEDMLKEFNLNQNTIIIQMNKDCYIKSKLFNGVNVIDYQMNYNINDIEYKKFNRKLLYEQSLFGKKYENIMEKLKDDNIKIVNLIRKKWYY